MMFAKACIATIAFTTIVTIAFIISYELRPINGGLHNHPQCPSLLQEGREEG